MNSTLKNINALVGLDLSEMDDALIEYMGIIQNIIPIQKILFLHNINLLELPSSFKTEEKLKLINKKVIQNIESKIKYANLAVDYEILIVAQPYADISFTDAHKKYKTNLLILGNKQNLNGNGRLTQKLIRILNTATLLVPEIFNHIPEKVALAIDFSKFSDVVVQYSDRIQSTAEKNGVSLTFAPISVSRVSGILYPDISDKEYQKRTEKDMESRYKRWEQKYPDYHPLKVIEAKEKGESNIASTLNTYIDKENIDLLILGILGRTDLKGLFLGSVSNELLDLETRTAMLFVKDL